ncbi:probable basic-leucine zipper transcription factor Q [Anastrepha ludens]|uniref:probable basic-leucine zipper transcription factor Q n=1 Tax=Anastrepha ludens TaxID=28586 RepID=UPI0023B0CA19|nr:probable basic-leucine zipper transcription factor Q [Anastrepha ludens]
MSKELDVDTSTVGKRLQVMEMVQKADYQQHDTHQLQQQEQHATQIHRCHNAAIKDNVIEFPTMNSCCNISRHNNQQEQQQQQAKQEEQQQGRRLVSDRVGCKLAQGQVLLNAREAAATSITYGCVSNYKA